MSAHLVIRQSILPIARLTICLALLAAFGQSGAQAQAQPARDGVSPGFSTQGDPSSEPPVARLSILRMLAAGLWSDFIYLPITMRQ